MIGTAPSTRFARRLVAMLVGAGVALGMAGAPASAAAGTYTALGDSYSSGVGTRAYITDGTACKRSRYAYPSLVAAARHMQLRFGACSGATSVDVVNRQLGFLTSATTLVTVSAGGNDAGFSSVLTECAKPAWASDCAAAVTRARSTIRGVLPRRLDTMYAAIRARAPHARIVVIGYPWLFDGTDCNAGTFFSPADESALNGAATLLDDTTRGRAAAHRISFVDPRAPFVGHRVCDRSAWINGLSEPVAESYHPNRSGHLEYAALVRARL